MSSFDSCFTPAHGVFADVFGISGTYKRADGSTATITVELVNRSVEVTGEDNIRTTVEYIEAIFDPTELVLGGVQREPRKGDTIQVTINSVSHTFQIMPVGEMPPWDYTDVSHKRIKANMNEVG